MQTIKTAVVVVLLLVVLYGAYIAINGSDTELPAELQSMITANNSEMSPDVSMPGFGPGGLTQGSGLKPSSPFGGTPGLAPSSVFPAAPSSSVFNSSPGNASAAPETLAPPKLTSIPNFPPVAAPSLATAGNASNFGNPTESKPEVPSFSLNVGSAADPKTGITATPPNDALMLPKPLEPASPMSVPGTVVSTTTVPNEAIPSLPTAGLQVPEANKPVDAQTLATEKKANITGRSFENAKKAAIEQIDRGEFKEALAKMSVFYNSPELTAEQNLDLINLLDSLAGETIYSRRHLLDTPYIVGPGETIEDLAKRYEVPTELLAKINAVDMTMGLLPGTKLKVFRGPFRAEVDVNRHEMTVFLGDLYAGRFPVSTGADPKPTDGVFQVLDKQRHRNYYGKGGLQIDGNDPRNPYGGWWMDLGQDLSIHGSPDNPAGENNSLGCISLSPLDAGDVFSMLSRGSQVTIKR